ncbi:MAG: hypothetical protein Q8N23_25455 [Archangium sp.]|nr:hypothetical protein [Archangium sp.]MDP3572627.1 hypothetical protein [Archangium sp.]
MLLSSTLMLLAQAPDGGAPGPEPTTQARDLIGRTTESEFDEGKHVRFGPRRMGPLGRAAEG